MGNTRDPEWLLCIVILLLRVALQTWRPVTASSRTRRLAFLTLPNEASSMKRLNVIVVIAYAAIVAAGCASSTLKGR